MVRMEGYVSDRLPPVHHRSPAFGPGTFQHYRPGCLCQRCPHYFGCRVRSEVLVTRQDTGHVTRDDIWRPKSSKLTPAMKKILALLNRHPDGLTVREIASRLGLSARHTYRCMSFLVTCGRVKKLWQIQREYIIDTMKRHYETTEIAHRYVINRQKR